MPIEVEKTYWETGPFEDEEKGPFRFNWTIADILNPLAASGLTLRRVLESSAEDSRFWQDYSYSPGTDDSLLDWNENPWAALPVWLAVAEADAALRRTLHRAMGYPVTVAVCVLLAAALLACADSRATSE